MTPLAPQREHGVSVTSEIRNPMGWIVGRTHRLAHLLEVPEIQEMVQGVVTHLDNYCQIEDIDPQDLSGNVLRTRALKYITIKLGSRPCWACDGKGIKKGSNYAMCDTCEGTGVR